MKIKRAIFYAKRLPSGFYAVYANGYDTWLDAALGSVDSVRQYIDRVAAASKINSYSLTFNEAEYKYQLEHAA